MPRLSATVVAPGVASLWPSHDEAFGEACSEHVGDRERGDHRVGARGGGEDGRVEHVQPVDAPDRPVLVDDALRRIRAHAVAAHLVRREEAHPVGAHSTTRQ